MSVKPPPPAGLNPPPAATTKQHTSIGHKLETVAKDVVKAPITAAHWMVSGTKGNPLKIGENLVGLLEGLTINAIDPPNVPGEPYPVGDWHTDSRPLSAGLRRGPRIDSQAGYEQLAKMGYKGMFDLRLEGADDAERGANKAGLNTGHAAIIDNTPPTDAEVGKFLNFVTDPKNVPCYVHCEAGKGRTGVMSAVYRMACQGVDPGTALKEAVKLGCAMPDQRQYILNFGKKLGWVEKPNGSWALSGKSKVNPQSGFHTTGNFPLNPAVKLPPGNLDT